MVLCKINGVAARYWPTKRQLAELFAAILLFSNLPQYRLKIMSSKLAYGVGFNDRKYPTRVKGKNTKQYHLWYNLLARCCCPDVQKKHPTYIGCTVSENFKNYSYFYAWCQNQIGFGQKGFQLDKDLLLKGNKVYSETSCLFLPRELNNLLTSSKQNRGNLPIGVSVHQGRLAVRCCRKPAPHHVGLFDTVEEAFATYKQVKESYIKSQAEKWKDQIDIRAYEALMRYEVLPTD